jgi:hypothetical protein
MATTANPLLASFIGAVNGAVNAPKIFEIKPPRSAIRFKLLGRSAARQGFGNRWLDTTLSS